MGVGTVRAPYSKAFIKLHFKAVVMRMRQIDLNQSLH